MAPPAVGVACGTPRRSKLTAAFSYVSGGVGESERSDLHALSSQFNLHLMFATQGSGEYLSAVQVTILDANKAPVLSAESSGPWFYAQLPPGDYSVEVTPTGLRGEDQTQRKVGASRWLKPLADGFLLEQIGAVRWRPDPGAAV